MNKPTILEDTYSKNLINEIALAINGIEIPDNARIRIAGGLFDIVHEHHCAIHLLLSKGLSGSATALLRSTFESYVRGVWFMECAADIDVERFQVDKFKEGYFENRVREIKEANDIAYGGLLDIKQKAWAAWNSYTHGGFLPVSRRFKGYEVTSNYSKEEVDDIARVANSFAVLAVFQIAELGNNHSLKKKAEEISKKFTTNYS